jgi:hypothetical protein
LPIPLNPKFPYFFDLKNVTKIHETQNADEVNELLQNPKWTMIDTCNLTDGFKYVLAYIPSL